MRLIHAVRDLNCEPDAEPIQTIALYTDAEPGAMFVREADIAYPLGPAAARPYLDLAVLERALVETGADAVWVGWGFVAEDPAFADLCARLGVTFIGPSAEAMRKLGDKIGSKLIAEEVGVPVAPWSRGGVDTLEEALAAADKVGYPLMLKATAGGGGRGSGWWPARPTWRTPTSAPATRPSGPSAAAWSSSSGWSPARGTSRCR